MNSDRFYKIASTFSSLFVNYSSALFFLFVLSDSLNFYIFIMYIYAKKSHGIIDNCFDIT